MESKFTERDDGNISFREDLLKHACPLQIINMLRRKSSAFESMFKSRVLEEKAKPTRERRILFPQKYETNTDKDDSNHILDIGAYR